MELTLRNKASIHQVTTMLALAENALFPGHNHLLTTSADDLTPGGYWTIISKGTRIHENIFKIQHEILQGYTTTKWARDEYEDHGRQSIQGIWPCTMEQTTTLSSLP